MSCFHWHWATLPFRRECYSLPQATQLRGSDGLPHVGRRLFLKIKSHCLVSSMISGCCAASKFSACSRISSIDLDFTKFMKLERTGVVALTFPLGSYGHQLAWHQAHASAWSSFFFSGAPRCSDWQRKHCILLYAQGIIFLREKG